MGFIKFYKVRKICYVEHKKEYKMLVGKDWFMWEGALTLKKFNK
jgi:hypothetical protein